jgi:long-subunit acyl-CoA synthetase (AMP-forming)
MIFDVAADGTRQHSFGTLCEDAAVAAERLKSWGVTRHMRVGIYAASSYEWLVHDLALIEIGAISVPFTDDFSGQIGQPLLDRYQISLLLISKANARLFSDHLAHVAFLDKENGEVRALPATPSDDTDLDDQLSLVFSQDRQAGSKAWLSAARAWPEIWAPS